MAASRIPANPPTLSEGHLSFLIDSIRDWQYQHGSLLKYPPFSGKALAFPIGVALFPSNFPRQQFEEARSLQTIHNKLYAAISLDETWLLEALRNLMEGESMAKILWKIHIAVKDEGYVQNLSLGLFRSDYMLHVTHDGEGKETSLQLKQVEFNTYSVAGGAHANKVSDMHRHFLDTGAYGSDHTSPAVSLPHNPTIESFATALALAHSAYGSAKSGHTSSTGILFVVQPNNVNICDERPIEYALQKQGIPAYRVEFNDMLLAYTILTSSGELLFDCPTSVSSVPIEISVVYMRAGYDIEEYNEVGCEARFRLEKSRAIKCPSLLGHLATLKIVQQKLAMPGELERFLSPEEAARIARSFVALYPLDDSELGKKTRDLIFDPESIINYVLKPSLEGGGHNIYREKILPLLKSIPEPRWKEYILMELIRSPEVNNVLLPPRGMYSGPIVSELGVFGTCLWRDNSNGGEVVQNNEAGFSFKTKRKDVDEMSVVKGYGCFDSPCLI